MRGVGCGGRGRRLFWCRWGGFEGLVGDAGVGGRVGVEVEVEHLGDGEGVLGLVVVVGAGCHRARIPCLRAR